MKYFAWDDAKNAQLTTIDDRRRMTNFATNLGAGLTYRVNDWLSLLADCRTFLVH